MVAECIGGATLAYEYVKACLEAGKNVVTSNKELVAEKGLELTTLARRKGVNFLFEASVGGGIPILRPICQCLAANEISSVCGILNGTTNYILTEMIQMGKSFEQALREAQEKGYAEADPTADVEGLDAGRKICILADLCFGKNVAHLRHHHGGDNEDNAGGHRVRPGAGLQDKAAGPGHTHGAQLRDRLCGTAPHLQGEPHRQRGRGDERHLRQGGTPWARPCSSAPGRAPCPRPAPWRRT